MRTNLFRTDPVLVDGAAVEVAIKDIDGVDPWTLVIENMSVAAKLRTRFGSKNANMQFTALVDSATPYERTADTGNDIGVEITAAPDQAFSVVVTAGPYTPYGGAITINARCDSDGRPNQFVSEIVDLLNEDADVAALVRVSLPSYSDGSAVMEIPDGDAPTVVMPLTYLSGGSNADATGACTVKYAAKGYPDYAGPWITHTNAGSALSTISAESAKAYTFVDVPFAAVLVEVSKGSGNNTYVVLTGVARKKNL